MKTIEDMRKELAAVGYKIIVQDAYTQIQSPQGLLFEKFFTSHEQDAIAEAYQYHQNSLELEALRRFKALALRVFRLPSKARIKLCGLSEEDEAFLKQEFYDYLGLSEGAEKQ